MIIERNKEAALKFLEGEPAKNMSLIYIAKMEGNEIYITEDKYGRIRGVLANFKHDPGVENYYHLRADKGKYAKKLLKKAVVPHSKFYIPIEYGNIAKEILGIDGLVEAEMVLNEEYERKEIHETQVYSNIRDMGEIERLFQSHPDYKRRIRVIESDNDKPAAVSLDDKTKKPVSFSNVIMFDEGVFRLSNLFTLPDKRNDGHCQSQLMKLSKYLFRLPLAILSDYLLDVFDAREIQIYVSENNGPAQTAVRRAGFMSRMQFLKMPTVGWMRDY